MNTIENNKARSSKLLPKIEFYIEISRTWWRLRYFCGSLQSSDSKIEEKVRERKGKEGLNPYLDGQILLRQRKGVV